MAQVRDVAMTLAAAGEVELRQRGSVIAPFSEIRGPLRIALAWSDAPGPTIVNNLNLIVTGPKGHKFVGNQRRNGPPTLDGTNNVELVHVEKPAAGVWTVDVVGSNVARGPQDFALVSIGHF